jgi:hypothetical protein
MARFAASLVSLLVAASFAVSGYSQSPDATRPGATGWRAPLDGDDARYGSADNSSTPPQAPITPAPMSPQDDQPLHAQVSKGSSTLPNDYGQVWREYDITPYTMRVESSQHPEQAIVDWILRETGYEAWHSTPVGLLSADRKVLRVYHTPQMQATVADIVDRFVSTKAQNHGFGLRIMTLKNPNWRTRAIPLMTSIPVQSPGVQGMDHGSRGCGDSARGAEAADRFPRAHDGAPDGAQWADVGRFDDAAADLLEGHYSRAQRLAGISAGDGAD